MTLQFLEGAEPLFIKGSNSGCLLLHGAGGGTAWDLKEFAKVLHSKTGVTIWLPILKGYGTRPEDLYGITFTDWMTNAREGVTKLQQSCDRIFVIGHSAGGLLALLLASEQKEINAVVTWAAPIIIRDRRIIPFPVINKIPIIRKVIPKKIASTGTQEEKDQGWVGYDWIPSSIGLVVLEGIKQVKQSFNKVICPTFIIQGTKDELVSTNSAKTIYQSISSRIKEIWYVEGASHPIMNEESYKKELFARTIAFLETASI